MINFITIRNDDFSNGIDQQSAPNKIPQGYVQSLTNMDPHPTGYLSKRRGYQGFAGNLPLRVLKTEQVNNNLTFIFPIGTAIPLNRSQPILVRGKSSTGLGEFASESLKYYTSFVSDIRKSIPVGTNNIVLPQDEHNVSSPNLFIGSSFSTSDVIYSSELLETNNISIDTATYDVTYETINNTGSAAKGFFFAADNTFLTGQRYVSGALTVASSPTASITITQATHQLSQTNLLWQIYTDTSPRTLVEPDYVQLNESTGDITFYFNNPGVAFDVIVLLRIASLSDFKNFTIAASTTTNIVIDNPDSGFILCSAYYASAPNILTSIEPNNILYDPLSNQITISFVNDGPSVPDCELYYVPVTVTTNRISVTASTSYTGDDDSPQLTVYGFDHSEIYGSYDNREGWVTHLDSYRQQGENFLIAGLGGNFYKSSVDTTNLLYPNLSHRVLSDTVIGPAFYDSIDNPSRTAGYLKGDDGFSNRFKVTAVNFVSQGVMQYILNVPNLVISGTPITTNDYLTVEQMGNKINNGSFKITAFNLAHGPDEISITVENDLALVQEYAETNTGGWGGIFTDKVTLNTSQCLFQAGDLLICEAFADTDLIYAVDQTSNQVIVKDVFSEISISAGIRINAERASYIIPLRNASFTTSNSVLNIVRGDMIYYNLTPQLLRVKSINQYTDTTIDITGDGNLGYATIEMAGNDTLNMWVGKKVLLNQAGPYNGVHAVASIIDSTTFTIESALDDDISNAVLVGRCIELDEQLTVRDNQLNENYFYVPLRWLPIEAPLDNFNQTKKTRFNYTSVNDYQSQPIISSTMIQDSLFMTNYDDDVLKIDSTSIYRAGLPEWQPAAFIVKDASVSTKINNQIISITPDSVSGNAFIFTTSPADVYKLSIGYLVRRSTDTKPFIIQNITLNSDETEGRIIVDRTISGAATSLFKYHTYRYYYRLNAVDINNNVVASAVTNNQDYIVHLREDSAIRHRLISLPPFDNYDYDTIRVQIYRTKANQVAPFFKVADLPVKFNKNDIYIDFLDYIDDDQLTEKDFDTVNVSLKGSELGTGWSMTPKAKYITSSGNRLLLANLSSYQTLDIQFLSSSADIAPGDLTAVANRAYLFRKSNTDVGTGTDMVNRATYVFTSSSSAMTITASTLNTSFEVTFGAAHNLAVKDWIYIFHNSSTGDKDLTFCGWWQISEVTSATVVKIANAVAPSAVPANQPTTATRNDDGDIPIFIGDDYSFGQVNGNQLFANQGVKFLLARRLSMAINASMRATNPALSGQENFVPWMMASSGNNYNSGQVTVKKPLTSSEVLELVTPALNGAFKVFVNQLEVTASSSAGAVVYRYPSRVCMSYPNFPEIWDNPFTASENDSDSVIDVNPADGEEITGIIPFFGESAFGSAQKSGVVLVFKTNSIYLVDLNAKSSGQQLVQKLDSMGKGCESPKSIASTKDGIVFANQSGLYRVSWDMRVDYVGQKYEKLYKLVNKDLLSIASGHHDRQDNLYKFCYPLATETKPSVVAVYNHVKEHSGASIGSWTQYDNHAALLWANLQTETYFASTNGRVYQLRRYEEDGTIYRDDDQAIPAEVKFSGVNGGESAIRKTFKNVVVEFEGDLNADSNTTDVAYAVDFNINYDSADPVVVTKSRSTNLLGETIGQDLQSTDFSLGNKQGIYLNLKISQEEKDVALKITSINIRAGLRGSGQGVPQSNSQSAGLTQT